MWKFLYQYILILQKMDWITMLRAPVLVLLVSTIAPPLHAQSDRITDTAILQQGQKLYLQNCAACHGKNAQGIVENWRQPGPDGKLPAPPLNGSAHTWHHSIQGLAQTIQNGTIEIGGSMPPWRGILSKDETFAIIIWLTSLWPDEIYEAWMERNRN